MARYVLSGPVVMTLLDGAPVEMSEPEQVPWDQLDSMELGSIEGFSTVASIEAEITVSGHAARRLRQMVGWALGPVRCRRHR